MDGDYTPREVAELHQAGQIALIDVRQSHEHEAGRIAGSRLIELAELASQADTLDRQRPIVFYCRTGSRSAVATQAFRASGRTAHNLDGGIVAWVERGLPIEPEDGEIAPH